MPREPSWWYQDAGTTARLLTPFAALYGAVAARRLTADAAYSPRLPVICVGNFTAGGSGKTPATAMLAAHLMARGERPAILTRGYGGRTRGPHWVAPDIDTAAIVGDEPLLLAAIVPTLVARDRRAGALAIEAGGSASVIVMDDGLQNPALAKDLSIAIVDGPRGFGNGCVIPAGPLRAPLAGQAARIDAIVFNGAPRAGLAEWLAGLSPAPQFDARLEPVGDVGWLEGQKVVAFAGIGHPARFFDQLRCLGADVAEAVAFPDHAPYTRADAKRLIRLANVHNGRLITTEKDAIRLKGDPALSTLVEATATLPVRMVLADAGQARLDLLLDAALMRR